MTMVGADADALVAASSRLHAAADDLDSASADLHRSLLAVSWLGAIATKFLQLFESSHQPRMKSSASFIRDAADNLARQAAEQRNASAAAGGGSGQTVPGLVPYENPDPHNVFGPSVQRVEISEMKLGIGVGPISAGEDATIRKEFLSDGTVRVTVIDGVSLGPAGKGAEAGVIVDAGNRHYGQDAGAGIDGAVTLQAGRVATFHSKSDANNYIRGIEVGEVLGQIPVIGIPLRGFVEEVIPHVTGGHVAVYTLGLGVAGNAHAVALARDYGVNADAHTSGAVVTAHYDDGSVGVAWTQTASGSAAVQVAGANEHKVFASDMLRVELRSGPPGDQLRVTAQGQFDHSLVKSETVVDLAGIDSTSVRQLVTGQTSVADFVAANAGASRTKVTHFSDQLDDYGIGVSAGPAGGGALSYTHTTLVQKSESYYHGFDLVPTP